MAVNMLFEDVPLEALSSAKFLYKPPWFSAIDISLSLTMIIKLLFKTAALLKPSNASPPLKEPSPISAMTFDFSPLRSLAFASPVAKLTEVEVWPITKWSCSLSWGFE